jgi:hypothetical protein
MAGLLNVLALLDVYGVAERRWLGREGPESGTEAPLSPPLAPAASQPLPTRAAESEVQA